MKGFLITFGIATGVFVVGTVVVNKVPAVKAALA
jgi:hypothetical protein